MSNKTKCKICEKSFIDKRKLVLHIDRCHGDQVPDEWTSARYENYLRTGKTHGTCVICKGDTPWNDVTWKYCRLCGKKSCTDKAREIAEKNLLKSKGVTHAQMLSDPDFQRKMVYAKRTSGTYKFTESLSNVEIRYDSSYGKDFLEMLDLFMGFCDVDIIGPSPNTYTYTYDGKPHFYIPDFYIPSLNLEVEIKDGGSNPNMHPKIQKVDKVKEQLKDRVMEKSKVNYVKISNKDYTSFFKMLDILKERDTGKISIDEKYVSILEGTSGVDTTFSDKYISQWFYQQICLARTDSDKTSVYSKLDACIEYLKSMINKEDISEQRVSSLKEIIYDLENMKPNLDLKISSQS